MLFRVDLPKCGAIEGSGVDTEQSDHKPGVVLTKLLLQLVNLIKKDCSFAEKIRLGFWAGAGEVKLGGKMIPQVLSSVHPWQYIPI